MKVLSLLQPWASLMAFGEKRIETRGHPIVTLVGHPLGIASSAAIPKEARALCETEPFKTALSRHGIASWRDLPLGQILSVVDVLKMLRTTEAEPFKSPAEFESAFGDYRPGRWAFPTNNLRRVQPVTPFLCTGPGLGYARCPDLGVGPKGEHCTCGGTFTRRAAGGQAPWFYPDEKLTFVE